jgi:hypothetical protein
VLRLGRGLGRSWLSYREHRLSAFIWLGKRKEMAKRLGF